MTPTNQAHPDGALNETSPLTHLLAVQHHLLQASDHQDSAAFPESVVCVATQAKNQRAVNLKGLSDSAPMATAFVVLKKNATAEKKMSTKHVSSAPALPSLNVASRPERNSQESLLANAIAEKQLKHLKGNGTIQSSHRSTLSGSKWLASVQQPQLVAENLKRHNGTQMTNFGRM